ncbi:sigma-E factor negative regulatory protein [Rhodoferax sp. U2-2l]|uniref:sigma-E factor negative regulatory protein n=1 Tax=Rhodoferax sp. U2-2l TaxID=2884000 RepID=UPI001D0A1820|nr:sigma-E factor negative regulatory protein [Rhodoferax sp. U2-2l]MCB8746674.1 sigma-E factor negative regulatory protein [Rhodoferax sp. U2-2l]
MSDQLRERSELVSALVDGQLHGDEFARVVAHLADAPEDRVTWDTYHLVGEVMRSSGAPVRAHDPAFVTRLRARLAEETIQEVAVSPIPVRSDVQKNTMVAVANDRWWKRVVGLASITMVIGLAWQGVAMLGSGDAGNTQLAQLPKPPVTAAPASAPATLVAGDTPSPQMLRDPQLDALLAAHRQMGGASVLQMPSGFLRNATFDEGKR